jgi:hypothetical protein
VAADETAQSTERSVRLYAGFISYASQFDSAVTEDVQRFLEGFRNNALVPEAHRKEMNICRDSSDFPFIARLTRAVRQPEDMSDLVGVIRGFLKGSEFLILFVRPESRAHPWLVKELDLWLELRGAANVAICLTSGDPEQPAHVFPEAILKNGLHQDLYSDLRGFRRENDPDYHGRSYQEELLRLAAQAGWRAKAAGQAASRKRERRRRAILISSFVFAVTVVAGVLVVAAWRGQSGSVLVSKAQASGVPLSESLQLALQAYPDVPELALPLIQTAAGKLAAPIWEDRETSAIRFDDIPTPKRPIPQMIFRSDGALALARRGAQPRLIDAEGNMRPFPEGGEAPKALEGWRPGLSSPSGYFLSAAKDGLLRVVDWFSPQTVQEFVLPSRFALNDFAAGDDGASVAAIDGDGKLWASGAMAAPCDFLPPEAQDRGPLLVAPRSEYVATDFRALCGEGACRRVIVIRPTNCQRMFDRVYQDDDFRELALATDARGVATIVVGMRRELRLTSLDTVEIERSVASSSDTAVLTASPDGRFVAFAGPSGDVWVLALRTLRKVAVASGYAENLALAFSRDGAGLAISGYEPGAFVTGMSRLDLAPDFAGERWDRGYGSGY